MFYTKLAKVLAALGFAFGALILVPTIFGIPGVGGHQLSGKTIDYGFLCIIGAAVLGVLAEISQSLATAAKGVK